MSSQIIPSHLAITAMRDSGYKNTAYALAELIDNAQQATARHVEVLCFQTRELISERTRDRISRIAVLDDGKGMSSDTLEMALQFGNGTRLNDRSGIGRFGMGLPNSSISQAGRVEVWSWQNGPDNALYTYIDVEEIENGSQTFVPAPTLFSLPDEWRDLSTSIGSSGTLVLWTKLDLNRLTWKSAKTTLENTEKLVGRIYRRFIQNNEIVIRLCALDDELHISHDRDAASDDPLFLTPSSLVPSPFDKEPMFEEVFPEEHEVCYNDECYTVKTRYSIARTATMDTNQNISRGSTKYGEYAAKHIGVSVLRANREIMLDQGWCIGYDPRERWWGAEVEFPPELDEVFGVTNNKQAATHFAELASIEWQQLAEDGEDFRDVVQRLQEEGDPKGYLLSLSDAIKRNLRQLRERIKAHGQGTRSTGKDKNRHGADPVTSSVNQVWKEMSAETPLVGEDILPKEKDYLEIQKDLTHQKQYSEQEAQVIVDLVKEADLRVVFLEADFPDYLQLFNVEIKGNLTEIIFNRRHPAFDDVFGTVSTAGTDLRDLSKEEISDKLVQAVNASKVIFAAWARYERQAGVDKAKELSKLRFHWGEIAARFLDE
jgi:hypothetical protein